eukprot:gene41415-biopygen6566
MAAKRSGSTQAERGPTVGDYARLADDADEWDVELGVLKRGEMGVLVEDDGGDVPYHVKGPRGDAHWYLREAVVFSHFVVCSSASCCDPFASPTTPPFVRPPSRAGTVHPARVGMLGA